MAGLDSASGSCVLGLWRLVAGCWTGPRDVGPSLLAHGSFSSLLEDVAAGLECLRAGPCASGPLRVVPVFEAGLETVGPLVSRILMTDFSVENGSPYLV